MLVVTCLRHIYLQHWSSDILIFLLLLLKTNVCQELNDYERFQHNSIMHITGKENVLKFLLRMKYFYA